MKGPKCTFLKVYSVATLWTEGSKPRQEYIYPCLVVVLSPTWFVSVLCSYFQKFLGTDRGQSSQTKGLDVGRRLCCCFLTTCQHKSHSHAFVAGVSIPNPPIHLFFASKDLHRRHFIPAFLHSGFRCEAAPPRGMEAITMGLGFLLSAPWTEGESDPPEVDRIRR